VRRGKVFTDVWFRVNLPNERESIFLGLDDLGGENELSFLLERKVKGNLIHRFGVIRGEPGYGVFQQLSPTLAWEIALRNVKEPEIDLSLWYKLFSKPERELLIFGRVDYQNGEFRPSLGIEYRF